MTPTGRTLVSLRRAGFMADICERWIPHANIRRDLYGLADVLAVHPTRREFLLVQATSAGMSATDWPGPDRGRSSGPGCEPEGGLRSGGWAKRGDRWYCKRVAIRAEHLAAVLVTAIARRHVSRQRGLFDAPQGEI